MGTESINTTCICNNNAQLRFNFFFLKYFLFFLFEKILNRCIHINKIKKHLFITFSINFFLKKYLHATVPDTHPIYIIIFKIQTHFDLFKCQHVI